MNVVVLAAHPDDEVLGCGGTIARHAADGDEVHVVFLTDGIAARGQAPDEEQRAITALRDATGRAHRRLGVATTQRLGLPDNEADRVPLLDVVRRVEQALEPLRPEVLYVHAPGDLNVDHQILHRAALTATRPQPGETVRTVLTYEVASATDWSFGQLGQPFRPSLFVDISAFLDDKLAALEEYQAEMRPFPHTRSIEAVRAQATVRGASVGTAAAEAFEVVRMVR